MCGLAGILASEASASVDEAALRRMTDAIAHRGPDGDGFHLEPGLGLGHRRLAVIDPEGGRQPMYNEDGSVVVVFNGMIYNHAELRPGLERAGHVFRSRCDTEVILHGWEQWGIDCLHRFSGMFAFALWDRRRGMLLLARDPLGKKPLYYAEHGTGSGSGLAFASELPALLALPGMGRRIDPRAVEDFFALGYIPDPGSIFAGIRRLPAAHFLALERQGNRLVVPPPRRYWQVDARARTDPEGAEASLLTRLRAATAARMEADVPLGAFLSSGVDSSAVVALAAGLRAAPLDTFTVGFPAGLDERPYARAVAARYRTAHHDSDGDVDYIEAARAQAAVFGEPFGDSSAVPTRAVCALARRHVTVALSGDGGDEVFAGYRRYRWHRMSEAVRASLPAGARRAVLGGLARAYPKLDRAPRWLRARSTLTELGLDSALGYYATLRRTDAARRRALLSATQGEASGGYDPSDRFVDRMEAAGTDDPLLQAQLVDLDTYLPGDILTKVDRASMSVSLEVRAPILDRDVVAWGLGLPPGLKLRRGEGKHVLRRAVVPLLPPAILTRPKQGFAMPLARQFREGAHRVRALLLGETMLDSGLFRPEAVTRLLDEHAAGRFDHSAVLWLLLVFEGFLAQQAGHVASPSRVAA